MISGAHAIIYSKNPVAVAEEFFGDILKLSNVDVIHGWLIFALAPAELAVHPSTSSAHQELYLMCDDIQLFVDQLIHQHIACGDIKDEGWGLLNSLTLPGSGRIWMYHRRYERPI